MNERDIFIAALEKPSAEARSEYLSIACAGDTTLRQRVEDLLRRHGQTGDFLQVPLVERLAEGVAARAEATEIEPDSSAPRVGSHDLGFLTPSAQPGSLGRLGHYEVQEVIGRGGMGIVLRAFDERLHRVVAIKVMAAQLATNAASRKRFQREARAAAAVCHDHIVTIHAVEESNDLPYLVMQCISGMSLQQRIDRDGPLALHEILRIGMQTAAGLAAAHAQGLIHRDIKPANILLENGVERVRLTDFGLARAAADASVSQTGIVVGTPQYMSPEQARGEAIDCRTDLFSLGSVLYAMCTGRAPFRAGNSIAVLKRVCEDAPSPIREANADVPDWLIALIDKLLAKSPDDRYQSAAEVADILGQRLAQLQLSTPLPLLASGGRKPPDSSAPAGGLRSPLVQRRWAVAAAVLLCLGVGFGLSEATGTTQLAATVIRILTPSGTLVVETDDPAVKVTVEGDGGLVITGAGLEEIRLRPGSYRVQADKDGKPVPLDKNLVEVARGGRAIVKVKMEAAPALVTAKAEKGVFVLLGGKGVAERKFDTLAEAVQGASDGDTIEVRGNGPFVSESIKIQQRLTIRAGNGFRPVIQSSSQSIQANLSLLNVHAPLVLEGLDLQLRAGDPSVLHPGLAIITLADAPLYAANCRLEGQGNTYGIYAPQSPACVLHNCDLQGGQAHCVFEGYVNRGWQLVLSNSIVVGTNWGLLAHVTPDATEAISVRLTHNTFLGQATSFTFPPMSPPEQAIKTATVEAKGNIFYTKPAVLMLVAGDKEVLGAGAIPGVEKPCSDADALAWRRFVAWREQRNLYPSDTPLLWYPIASGDGYSRIMNLVDWNKFWALPGSDSVQATPVFQGGDVFTRATTERAMLAPPNFRLRPDSDGYRAGKDGKDLGADVDLVGPGPAYERWKKTPEYQQWLKDTGQLRAETPKPEPKAFVVLTGKGVEVRKFDSLAEAVQRASPGDTIEIRGNGPFVTESITIMQPLTIRAGDGFKPVVQLTYEVAQNGYGLMAEAPLILEGVGFQRIVQDVKGTPGQEGLLGVRGGLHAANCRFLARNLVCSINVASPCELRNCEILHPDGAAMLLEQGTQVLLDNCLAGGSRSFWVVYNYNGHVVNGGRIRLTRNTFRASEPLFVDFRLDKAADTKNADSGVKWLRIQSSGNIFDANSVLLYAQDPNKILPTGDTNGLLTHILDWAGDRNFYAVDGSLALETGPDKLDWEPIGALKSLADWRQFWKSPETNSLEARVRYQGGDLLARLADKPDKLTPDDFRLHPDSPGYRAGKDKKDLGADVDLVGPGPAYERWKKTPEYQQWLKETKQIVQKAEPKAFVVLGAPGVEVRKHDTLAEAVRGASDGDTIEIRGNGPFVSQPINIGKKELTLRAAAGYRPTIQLGPQDFQGHLFTTEAKLVLEGLALEEAAPAPGIEEQPIMAYLLVASGAPIHFANSRFVTRNRGSLRWNESSGVVRNCELLIGSPHNFGHLSWDAPESGRMDLDNNVIVGGGDALGINYSRTNQRDISIIIKNSTIATRRFMMTWNPHLLPSHADKDDTPPYRIESSNNLIQSHVLAICPERGYLEKENPLEPQQAKLLLTQMLNWSESRNAYPSKTQFLSLFETGATAIPKSLLSDPDAASDWQRFWGRAEAELLAGSIHFQAGDVLERVRTPARFMGTDLRLDARSVGYRAGKDGKDLGADVDLVGPGPAYEKWKKTPEYQQWLKETGQNKSEESGVRDQGSEGKRTQTDP